MNEEYTIKPHYRFYPKEKVRLFNLNGQQATILNTMSDSFIGILIRETSRGYWACIYGYYGGPLHFAVMTK